jgi:hypothetical protein
MGRASLLRALREPASMGELAPGEWDVLLRQGRHMGTLGRLCALAAAAGVLPAVPSRVRVRLEASLEDVAQQDRIIRWEVIRLRRALAGTGVPLVLLKGAAYLHAGLPAARGRQFSDVDILVPRASLREVEAALLREGWEMKKLSAYDERYYREWSHELPPLSHPKRHVMLDVHHNILPPTGRLRPDPRMLLDAAVPVAGDGLRVLGPSDMVLHSACHLLQSGEHDKSLRDLGDLDALMRQFGAAPRFGDELGARAAALDVERPLFYALRFAAQLIGTPVPEATARAVRRAAPPAPVRAVMDRLFAATVEPGPPGDPPRRARLARAALTLRYHWLRMPPSLLARHLAHKIGGRRGRA